MPSNAAAAAAAASFSTCFQARFWTEAYDGADQLCTKLTILLLLLLL
jgi:hypothetical protein